MLTPAVLRTFRRRLTNLSTRNRSLLLTSLPAGQFLDLHETDFLVSKPSFTVIADLIARKSSIALCDVLDARQERSNEVSRKLQRINRTARFIEEERGTEDLYVGWPFVRGKFMDGTVIHGPLLFFPVKLEQEGKRWKLTRRGDELATLNPTLVLAYGQFNQIKLSDDVVEEAVDDFDKDPLVFRTQLYEWLKESPLEINFNQDLFSDKLQFYDKQTAKSLDQLERTGELKLYPEAILGIFPQAGSFLVPDYDELISKSEQSSPDGEEPVDTLLFLFTPTLTTSPLPERFIHTPLPLDASQEAAIRAVKAGQSLVVQGPPGTGKSQLIANLMADAAASGKRVLLVCQKRAALDVVQERLRQVGMAPFLALIHDFQDDRRALYDQIAGQIEQIEPYRQQNNSLNTVLLERDFDVESRQIDQAVLELQTFKDALFDSSEYGISAKELYLTSRRTDQVITLDDLYPHFHINSVDNFVRRLADYAAYQHKLGPSHIWMKRVSFASFSTTDLTKADQTIERWLEARDKANEETVTLLHQSLPLEQLVSWQSHDWDLTALLTLLDVPDATTLWTVAQHLRNNPTHPALVIDETRLDHLAEAWAEALSAPGPETSLPTADLRAFRSLVTDAMANRSSWVQWNWWQLTNPGKSQLQQIATSNGLVLSRPGLEVLAKKIDQRIRLEAILYEAGPLFGGLSLTNNPENLRFLRRAQHLTERLQAIEPLRQLPEPCWQTHQLFTNTVKTLLNTATAVVHLQEAAQIYLTNDQLQAAWQSRTYVESLRQSLQRDFDLLVETDRLQESFSDSEHTIVERLQLIDYKPTDWTAIFLNSLRLAWLDHLERKYPELRSVSSLKMEQTEQALQQSVQRKQALSRDILLVKLREQTYRNLTLNRLNNVVTYRELLHQTTKKRNVWPVRKLMESFSDEVFKLVPCWLASPESVSVLFPLRENLFDLVIFDEASQCFAENGIPAIARGKQIVITGDSQQLRPSDLYRTRLDENEPADENAVVLEVESLLELAAQQLPQISLTEHYRSRSLDLITFSNQHFYRSKLSLLPHFEDLTNQIPAIRYLNVKGTWQQNTNLAEAEAVLKLLDQIVDELPGRTIGIVTFNYAQQQLIQDMLDTADQQEDKIVNSNSALQLFVKNIENVQGDERDVIVFSTGYAPDERGRLSMQFGTLNNSGGENRLNVAITRARERIYVVTSLWPDQLTVDASANDGPKLLKAYLSYALEVAQGRFKLKPYINQVLPITALLKNKLANQYPNWQLELPFADLTIKAGDTYQSLVLTDDDTYYQQTPKQAHAYIPIALKGRHWPFQRFWSREYWRQPTTQRSPDLLGPGSD